MSFDAGAHAGLNGGFVILDFPPPPEPYPKSADDRIVSISTWTSSLYLEQLAEFAAYTAVFELIRAEALSPEPSRNLLRQIGKDLAVFSERAAKDHARWQSDNFGAQLFG